MRPSGRAADQLRDISLETNVAKHAEGSCLARFGDTHVLCAASVEPRVPPWMRDTGRGWVTAEYGMLPRSTHTRTNREASHGKQSGRTQEIQRLIGRSLRAATNLEAMGEIQIKVDCDVIQADGGTRTAAITGAWLALADALDRLLQSGALARAPLTGQVASVAVGLVEGKTLLDLDYAEDNCADTDMNVVMDEKGRIVEIQGTAEGSPFDQQQLQTMITLAQKGIRELIDLQQQARLTHSI